MNYKKFLLLTFFLNISSSAFAECKNANVYEDIQCYEKQYKNDKIFLNQIYQKLYKSIPDEEGRKALENSQKAWLNYRNIHCDELLSYYASQTQGAGSKLINLSCNADITRERIKDLKDLAQE